MACFRKTNMKKLIAHTSLATLLISISPVNATPFLSLDPRSVGMGGTGVAIGNSSQAHYYNPALLVSAPASEDFNIEIDLAIRGTDSDSLIDGLQSFGEEKYLSTFVTDTNALITSIDSTLNRPPGSGPITAAEINTILTNRDNLLLSSNNLRNGIHAITNKSLIADVNAGFFMSSPDRDFGWTVFFNSYLPISAQGNLHPNDDELMVNMINVVDFELTSEDLQQTAVDLNNLLTDLNDNNPSERLLSSVSLYGALIREIGFSYATKATMDAYDFDFGVSPKIVLVEATDETRTLNRIEFQSNIENNGKIESYTSLNLDLGVSKQLSEKWKTGLAVKNIIPQSYKTPNGEKINIDPAARIGIGFQSNWFNLGADFDLTKNSNSVGFGESQYASVGAEVDVWLMQLRAGYRYDITSEISYPSLGVGLYLFGLNIDGAIAGKAPDTENANNPVDVIAGIDEFNASLRIGARW